MPAKQTGEHDEVAIVTGAGGGLGRAISLRLAREGKAIAVLDVAEDRARETLEAVQEAGGSGVALAVDVGDRSQVADAVGRVERELGPISSLVNNAGVVTAVPLLDTDDEAWRHALQVNLLGPFYLAREAVPLMASRGRGSIVNITSVAALRANGDVGAYAASKGGLEALTRQMALEFGPLGIRANAVAPGTILTPLNISTVTEAGRVARLARIPEGRLGEPDDIASVVAFLVSADAGYLQGVTIPVDGGYVITGVRAQLEPQG